MSEQHLLRQRRNFTALVVIAVLAHLGWEYFNGGIASHHLLNRADLPAISNGWGLLLLPVLTWFLVGRVHRRVALASGRQAAANTLPASVVVGFAASLLFGVALSVAFTNGYDQVAAVLFGSMLLLAVGLPVYRAECLLGFVLGMTFTFGGVLPTLIGSILAAVSALVHLYAVPLVASVWSWFRRGRLASG